MNLLSTVHICKRGSHTKNPAFLVVHVYMISKGMWRGEKMERFFSPHVIYCIPVTLLWRIRGKKYSWGCRRTEKERERLWLNLYYNDPQSFKQTYRDFLRCCFALVMSLNGYRWLHNHFHHARTWRWGNYCGLNYRWFRISLNPTWSDHMHL